MLNNLPGVTQLLDVALNSWQPGSEGLTTVLYETQNIGGATDASHSAWHSVMGIYLGLSYSSRQFIWDVVT